MGKKYLLEISSNQAKLNPGYFNGYNFLKYLINTENKF